MKELQKENFSADFNGKKVELYTIKNKNGMFVKITNQGGKILQLVLPDGTDVVLGYDNLEDTFKGRMELGATIGRYANRIAKGKFKLDGNEYSLSINDGENHLHGGKTGVHTQVLDLVRHDESTLVLQYKFRDGEDGYPGNCTLNAGFYLNDDNALELTFEAETDAPTIVNFTNHAYFNLRGAGNGNILDHEMTIFADNFTLSSEELLPTGEIAPVKGSPLDFTTPHKIGERISSSHGQIIAGRGYDHNFILNSVPGLAAVVVEPESGRVMEVWTTEPAIQLYTGNFLDDEHIGKESKVCGFRSAFCLETQHFPDSPNHENFPSTILRPDETFKSKTVYKFR